MLIGIIMFAIDIILFYEIINYKKRDLKKNKKDILVIFVVLLCLGIIILLALMKNDFGYNKSTFLFVFNVLFLIEFFIMCVISHKKGS